MFAGKWSDGTPIKFAKGQQVRVLRSLQFRDQLVTIMYPLQKNIGKFYSCQVEMPYRGASGQDFRATFSEDDLVAVGEAGQLPENGGQLPEREEKPGIIMRFFQWLTGANR